MTTSHLDVDSDRSKWLYFAGIGAVVLVVLINILTIQRQSPWEDEIFAVSTGWSMARSQPPTLSVLAQYPRTGSPIHFYGPVSFAAEAALIRIFGLSATAWRVACLAGAVLSCSVSWGLVKAAGGDHWARLLTALIIVLSGSLNGPLAGRWDPVTAGLFLGGLLFLLRGTEQIGRAMTCRIFAGGVLIGLALASSPRALTLTLAALITISLSARCFRGSCKNFVLGSLGMFAVALLVQTLLLLPWGLNTFSWYAYLRAATRKDGINATPLVGHGGWNLDANHHKTLVILFVLLLSIAIYGAIKQPKLRTNSAKQPVKVFLTLFAGINLALMLLLLANALAQAPFWLPPTVAAFTCWVDWDFPRDRRVGIVAVSLVSICLLMLFLQEAEQTLSVLLTWNRRSTADLQTFVETTLPKKAVVYGPIGGYFYSVELSKRQYLYVYEQTTPGLYSEPRSSVGDKLDLEICAHPTYAIWPKPDSALQPQEQPMPGELRDRIKEKVGEFDQPPLAPWKLRALQAIGEVGGKYGFPDAVAYSLRNIKPCEVRSDG